MQNSSGLNLDAVGEESPPVVRTWNSRDAMIYALGVGAGALDPTGAELQFTTENSHNHPQAVLPTFATIAGGTVMKLSTLGDIDYTKVVHGDEGIALVGPLPPDGSVSVRTRIEGVYDKGSGALVVLDSTATSESTGDLLLSTRMGVFIRGAGGFGGPRAPEPSAESEAAESPLPRSDADHLVRYTTRRDQALLYRLSGDRNPLHSDPSFAKRAGFERPILHGLCSYGFAGRALLNEICNGDPHQFLSMRGRFSKPTYPGDELTTSIWDVSDKSAGTYRFHTENQRGERVIDSGLFRVRNSSAS